jgi:RsmE family RNA methyltransferase
VNLLLLTAAELDDAGQVTLDDRRAVHLIEVLQVAAGDTLKTGLVDGPLGSAQVIERLGRSVRLRCQFDSEPPQAPQDVLLLAMPRPKVLARCLEHATSLGFGRVVVFRTNRCVKSHFDSHVLEPEQIHARLVAGLEQSRRTHLPKVEIHRRFRPFVEDVLPGVITADNHFLADAEGALAMSQAKLAARPLTLVIGPEGGLIPHEVTTLAERGFAVVSAGPHPLRVEAALSAVTAQLQLLRQLAG